MGHQHGKERKKPLLDTRRPQCALPHPCGVSVPSRSSIHGCVQQHPSPGAVPQDTFPTYPLGSPFPNLIKEAAPNPSP